MKGCLVYGNYDGDARVEDDSNIIGNYDAWTSGVR